jgi:predicted molibdopterin-dependent oxidoreductase YjgC
MLLTGAALFNCGSLSTKTPAINTVAPEAVVELSREDAAALGIKSGDQTMVTSDKGSLEVKARVTPKQLPGTAFIAYHFTQPAVQELTAAAQPYTLVKIEKQN